MKKEDKLRKAAEDYFCDEVVNGDTDDDKTGWVDCFMTGADAALKSQWHDVKDELPEDGKLVLVKYMCRSVCNYAVAYMEYGVWFSNDKMVDDYIYGSDVFAWMYIPD